MARLSFLPRETKFFDLFDQSAANAVKSAQALNDLLCHWENVETKVAVITELEHQGDSVAHEIIAQLHRTFVTPFDREDIVMLGHSLDDVVDFIEAAADAMLLYKINAPTVRAIELTGIIVQITIEVQRTVELIHKRLDLKEILRRCVEINRLENDADRVYRDAMAELFDDSKDIPYIIKWREIYNYLETATDRCEDVANVIEGVALKYG
jgi:predicted phosphate transport protein (TIGR00153 family)